MMAGANRQRKQLLIAQTTKESNTATCLVKEPSNEVVRIPHGRGDHACTLSARASPQQYFAKAPERGSLAYQRTSTGTLTP